jgi:hypothetical protein
MVNVELRGPRCFRSALATQRLVRTCRAVIRLGETREKQRQDDRERESPARLSDEREGQWTKLRLLEMDELCRMAVRREVAEPAVLSGSGRLSRR